MFAKKIVSFSPLRGDLSSLFFFFERGLVFFAKQFEKGFSTVLPLIFFLAATLTNQLFASNDPGWEKVCLEKIGGRSLSPTGLNFQKSFLAEVHRLSEQNPSDLKEEISFFLQRFHESPYQYYRGKDQEVRPIYVSAQGDFERTMALMMHEKKITHLVGIIHTPTPATPLCTKGRISSYLVDQTMLKDQKRLYTVMKRPEIIRDFLDQGGILIAAYPKQGLEKRTKEQMAIFNNLKEKYPQHLIDLPLECEEICGTMVGATYLFRTRESDWFAFGIMASQANAPKDDHIWGMWFGPVYNPIIFDRVQSIFDYLHQVQSQDLSSILFKTQVDHLSSP